MHLKQLDGSALEAIAVDWVAARLLLSPGIRRGSSPWSRAAANQPGSRELQQLLFFGRAFKLPDYQTTRLPDTTAGGMWRADLRDLADFEGSPRNWVCSSQQRQLGPVSQGTARRWCYMQANSYGAGNRKLQCSLAHASMLEARHATQNFHTSS